MSKLKEKFINEKAFVAYITAGDPDINTTKECIISMQAAGADIVVIGIPFSDPIAESKEIQDSNLRALKSQTYIKDIFEMLKNIGHQSLSIVLYTYMNPLFNYGYEKFLKESKELGIEGIMFADMPYEEKSEIEDITKKYDIDIITFAPCCQKDRIQKITKEAQGFIGIFPSENDKTRQNEIVKEIKEVTDTPICIAINGMKKDEIEECKNSYNGIMVSSEIAKILKIYGKNSPEHIFKYISELNK